MQSQTALRMYTHFVVCCARFNFCWFVVAVVVVIVIIIIMVVVVVQMVCAPRDDVIVTANSS